MKFIIVALAIILMAQASLGAPPPKYISLPTSDVLQSQLIYDLRDLGADYVIQHGVFVSTKNPLPGNYYKITKTEKIEQRFTPSGTDYRYTVILTEKDNLAVVRATYVVSINLNGALAIPSFHYKIIGGNPNGKPSVGGPSLVDVRPFNNGTGPLSNFFGLSADFVIAEAREHGQLPESFDIVAHVYNAYLVDDSSYPPQYVFLFTVANPEGDTYRVQMTATEIDNDEHVINYSAIGYGPGTPEALEEGYVNPYDLEGVYENEYEFESEYSGEGFHGKNKIEFVIYPNS